MYRTIGTNYKSIYKAINGKAIEKTPSSHPYSYDEFVLWLGDLKIENTQKVYSDRLRNLDSEKNTLISKEVFGDEGQYFNNRKPEDIELYLCKMLDKKIKLTAITEACNVASGYPYWGFIYEEVVE